MNRRVDEWICSEGRASGFSALTFGVFAVVVGRLDAAGIGPR